MNETKIANDRAACVRFFGRTGTLDGGVLLPWTDSGFVVRFRGTALEARLLANHTENPDAAPYIAVFVDGGDRVTIGLTAPESTVTLAENLADGEHTVMVVKLSEALQSHLVLTAILTDGELLTPPASGNTRRIQFVGDSITTGFGLLAPSEQAPFRTGEQDGWQSYAAMTARELHADFHVFAISGFAVYKSPFGGNVPSLYPFVDGAEECRQPWDYNRFQPDVTVVNLGTNDHAWFCNDCSQHLPEEERHRLVENAYYDFLQQLRVAHPHSKFVCTIGQLVAFTARDVDAAVKRAAADGMDVIFVPVPLAKKYGAGHPALSSHREATALLVPAIRKLMNWND